MPERWLAFLLITIASFDSLAKPVEQTVAEFPSNFAYRAFNTEDSLGRSIRFYLSDSNITDDRPLILVIQGSGCSSHFFSKDGRLSQGWHAFVRKAARDRAQILLVEKPGVKLFDQQSTGDARLCSAEFRTEQTKQRWLSALTAALHGVTKLRGKASVRSSDTFAIELIIRKRDITWLRIPGGDHGFARQGDESRDNLSAVIGHAIAWLFNETFDRQYMVWPLN